MLYSKHSIAVGKILQNFFHSSSLTIIPFSSPLSFISSRTSHRQTFPLVDFPSKSLEKKRTIVSFLRLPIPCRFTDKLETFQSNLSKIKRVPTCFQNLANTYLRSEEIPRTFGQCEPNITAVSAGDSRAAFQPGWGGGGAAEGMIIIANERFSLNCLPTIIFLSLFPSPSPRKTAAFISTPDHLGEYGWRGGWWLIYSEKLGWNIGISWRKGREAWRVSQSMGFASFCFVSEMSSLPPPHCVATSRWRGKILPGKEKGKVKRLKGGFGIWSWAVTLELFRDLHALETPVFGHAEDEEGKRKILACLIP